MKPTTTRGTINKFISYLARYDHGRLLNPMPPRPKPIPVPRKQSFNASKDASKVKSEPPSKSMPPPPVPVTPMGILEPEMNALSTCLQVCECLAYYALFLYSQ